MKSPLKKPLCLTPQQKLSAARLLATMKLPYFTSGLLSLAPVWLPDSTLSSNAGGTLSVTDNWVLLIEPAAVQRWSVDQLAGVLVHEMLHVLREHFPRSRNIGVTTPGLAKLWNISGDLEINDDLLTAELELPPEGIFPKTFGFEDGLSAEHYYRKLLDMASVCPKCQKRLLGNDLSEDGDGCPKQKTKGKSKNTKKNCPLCSAGNKPAAGGGWCGSGAGRPVPGEADRSQEIRCVGRSPVEAKAIRKKVAADIKEAAQKSRGTVPAEWARWADEVLRPPKIDWRTKLAQHARCAVAYAPGAVDFRYDRPSRRQAVVGFGAGSPVLPALRRPKPYVAIAVDTSGSMSSKDLREAVSEAKGILLSVGAEVVFIACDAAVGAVRRVRDTEELISCLVGGGGTDFSPVFDAVGTLYPRPEVLVYFTDGMGPAPAKPPPRLHTIWVLVGKAACEPHFPGEPWGDMIWVDDQEEPAEAA